MLEIALIILLCRDSELGRRGRKKTRITTLRGLTFAILALFFIFVLFRYVFAFGPSKSATPGHVVPNVQSGDTGLHAPDHKGVHR
jgi:hypothetical protein